MRVLTPLLVDDAMPRLASVSWDEWGSRLLPSIWKLSMDSRMEALRSVTLSSLPSLLSASDVWWERLRSGINVFSPEARRAQLRAWLGHWVALSLLDAGFTVASQPGAEPVLTRDGVAIEPFRWVQDLASGARTAEEWEFLRL
jgi:hypothetical protein